jgi:hypothetical protein
MPCEGSGRGHGGWRHELVGSSPCGPFERRASQLNRQHTRGSLCRRLRLRREAKSAADAAGAATWAPLLGGGMDVGQVEESEAEHDDWRDYLRVKDDNFHHNF